MLRGVFLGSKNDPGRVGYTAASRPREGVHLVPWGVFSACGRLVLLCGCGRPFDFVDGPDGSVVVKTRQYRSASPRTKSFLAPFEGPTRYPSLLQAVIDRGIVLFVFLVHKDRSVCHGEIQKRGQ